ncbi:hypothetical protein [Microbacterium sp. YY-01]|uniref:hypothetical protein n=1 Tax=Microbacterium sp. YY-01 TaxID=3421634 RepID=UPI003D1724DB
MDNTSDDSASNDNASNDNAGGASNHQFGGRGDSANISGFSAAAPPAAPYVYSGPPQSKSAKVWGRVGITLGIILGGLGIIVGIGIVVLFGVCVAMIVSM